VWEWQLGVGTKTPTHFVWKAIKQNSYMLCVVCPRPSFGRIPAILHLLSLSNGKLNIYRVSHKSPDTSIWDLNAFLSSDLWPTLYICPSTAILLFYMLQNCYRNGCLMFFKGLLPHVWGTFIEFRTNQTGPHSPCVAVTEDTKLKTTKTVLPLAALLFISSTGHRLDAVGLSVLVTDIVLCLRLRFMYSFALK
jgi:hypothetical protein